MTDPTNLPELPEGWRFTIRPKRCYNYMSYGSYNHATKLELVVEVLVTVTKAERRERHILRTVVHAASTFQEWQEPQWATAHPIQNSKPKNIRKAAEAAFQERADYFARQEIIGHYPPKSVSKPMDSEGPK